MYNIYMTYLRLELGGDAEIGALGELDHVLLVCVWWVDRSGVKNAGVIYQIHIQRAGVCAVNNTSPATTKMTPNSSSRVPRDIQ